MCSSLFGGVEGKGEGVGEGVGREGEGGGVSEKWWSGEVVEW